MNIIIDDKKIEVNATDTVLKAARRVGIFIPSLCQHNALPNVGACRLCMVEICQKGSINTKVVSSCEFMVSDGLVVKTTSDTLLKLRRMNLDLLLARAPKSEFLLELSKQIAFEPEPLPAPESSSECILCYLCTRVCQQLGCNAISMSSRSQNKKVSPPFETAPDDCIGCGCCARLCPVNFIEIKETKKHRVIWNKTFSLVCCETCGAVLTTKEQISYSIDRYGLDESYYKKCRECKQKETALQFSSVGR
jgi:bidirectional [NiFe] hydrogenase diaphorase subunit